MTALPEPYRTAVTLRFFDGLSPRVIARHRGQSVATARQHVHRGLVLLREHFDRRFGARGDWLSAFGVLLPAPALKAAALKAAAAKVATTLSTIPGLIPIFAMKKLALAAAVVFAAGAFWMLQDGDPAIAEPGTRVGSRANGPLAGDPSAAAGVVSPPQRELLPPPAESDSAPTFAVQVVDAEDRPRPGALVLAWKKGSREEEPQHALTDEDGCARFAAHAGAGGVLVRAPGFVRVVQEVAEFRGELRVVVGEGDTVGGTMLVDGQPAPAGLRLRLHRAPPSTGTRLPESVTDLLGSWWDGSEARTDAGGRFAFAGVGSDWSGHVATPITHWIVDQPGQGGPGADEDRRRLALDAPRSDLVLTTTRLPSVRGRVIWADDGEPARWPSLSLCGHFDDGANSWIFESRGDENGCFDVGFHPGNRILRAHFLDHAQRPWLSMVSLHATVAGAEPEGWIVLDQARLQRNDEVIVQLSRAAITHFLVLDEGGAPFAGAYLTSSRATEADGRGTFAGPRADQLVGAAGYQVVPAQPRAPAQGTHEDPLVFVLRRQNNRMILRLRTQDGAVPAVRRVRLVHGRLFAGGRAQHVFDLRFGGSRVDLTSQVVQADEHGEVLLHSLEPGQRCKVVVCDAMGSEVLAREIVTPALGETLAVDLVVTAVARCIRGRVQSTNEAPLVGATLHLTGGSGRTTDATTDGRGEFVFGDVYDSVPLRIVAVHPGYAAQQRSDLSPHGDSEAIVFRLPPGRNVTVRVVDENGIPGWGDIVLEGDWEDLRLFAPYRRLGPGIKTYFGLPPGMVTFSSWIGDELFGVRHDTAEPEAFLRVPRPARVVAVMPPSWTRPPGHIVVTATRLDPPAEPARQRRRLTLFIPSTRESRETVVVPGRYRFRLEKIVSGRGSEPDRHIPLGMGAEALLPVGELTRVQLR